MTGVALTDPDLAAGGVVRVAAQSESFSSRSTDVAAEILGLVVVAGLVALLVALLYRWYVRERVPAGLPILFGLSAVALYLVSSRALREVISPGTGTGDPLDEVTALVNVVTFLVALLAARAGTDVGDRIGADLVGSTDPGAIESTVNPVVQAVGRVITVELPEDVDDVVGYDPVPERTKEELAGKTFVFPRRLTVGEVRDRLVTRLKADYAVGHVDVELEGNGAVEYLALGSRASGIGPTLPPETAAVAIRADPAFAASAGDLVQVWETDPLERVLTGEVRGTADDVVTLAIDAADARRLDDTTEYKLVTLPVESRPDREFASVLRAADETMAAVGVADGSSLAGQPVGSMETAIVAVSPIDGPVEPLPAPDRAIDAGDTLYLVATPEAIRRVESAAAPPAADEPDEGAAPGSEIPPDRRIDAATPVAGEDGDGVETRDRSDAAGESNASTDGESRPPADSDRRTDAEPTEADEGAVSEFDDLVRSETDDEATGDEGEAADPDGDDTPADPDGDDAPAEPTADELADLPGTDPEELTGGDLGDGSALTDTGDGASEDARGEADADDEFGSLPGDGESPAEADPIAGEDDDSLDDSLDEEWPGEESEDEPTTGAESDGEGTDDRGIDDRGTDDRGTGDGQR